MAVEGKTNLLDDEQQTKYLFGGIAYSSAVKIIMFLKKITNVMSTLYAWHGLSSL